MDDLLGEDWQSSARPTKSPPTIPASNFSSLRASPQPPSTGNASPLNLSRPSSTVNGTKTWNDDRFGSLLGVKAQKPAANVSLLDRQKQLLEERRKQQEQSSQLWDTLGSGRGTPDIRGPSPAIPSQQDDDDDILAAFNKAAPVDKSSHFPPPASATTSGQTTRVTSATTQPSTFGAFDDDDDPFGLSSMPKRSNGHAQAPAAAQADDADILGDLGKPFIERRKSPEPVLEETNTSGNTEDRALAELVDMGFPASTAKIALAENGGDVQGAVGWLLRQAHEESKAKVREEAEGRRGGPAVESRDQPSRQQGERDGMPAWVRQESRSNSASRRQDNQSPANSDKDAGQMAQEFGSKLFKSANSLWKASQKQMAKTMAEFQQERDGNQPRWMSEASDSSRGSSQRRPAPVKNVDVTDEAAMLDAPRESKPPRSGRQSADPMSEAPSRGRPAETLPQRPQPQSRPMQQPPPDKRPTSKLSRQDVEDQSSQAYVSPARRKKATPQPHPPPPEPEPEVDLFSPAPTKPAQTKSVHAPTANKAPAKPAARPTPSRPAAPSRSIPSVSPAALATSASHRKKGGEAFKRGDYAAAHDSYTAALNPLPATHPITIIVLSNRSLTALKTGDPKTAVSDADRAIEIIGVSQGMGESIDLGGGEGTKDMREFYGKAVMRKAEALEHMEKWVDAASVWKLAVEAGVGGAISIRGRDRCEKAAAPKPAAPPKPRPVQSKAPGPGKAAPAKGLGNSLQRPALSGVASAEAVKKLREANAAAEKADDEKFALSDQVDAKLTAWKGGKADNLRALLQSLDGVLWAEAGWKKVGMSDLVMPNKVKIIYMKAIAKVHPDKIPQTATTEQRMISAAVFATLNEAWDKFKKDNNL